MAKLHVVNLPEKTFKQGRNAVNGKRRGIVLPKARWAAQFGHFSKRFEWHHWSEGPPESSIEMEQ
jgi:hypothetical protein